MNPFKAPSAPAINLPDPQVVVQQAAAPNMPDPVRVPNVNDPAVIAARRSQVQSEFANRQGRNSTRLTQDTSGGRDATFSRTTLG